MTSFKTDKQIKKLLTYGTIAVTGSKYYLPTDAEIDAFMQSEKIHKFISEFVFTDSVSDCSWAAWGFVWQFCGMGWAVSYEVVKGHALVRILNSEHKEIWIEPQTDKTVENNTEVNFNGDAMIQDIYLCINSFCLVWL